MYTKYAPYVMVPRANVNYSAKMVLLCSEKDFSAIESLYLRYCVNWISGRVY